jgi:NADH-quinone oxidoreductase subunit C/D
MEDAAGEPLVEEIRGELGEALAGARVACGELTLTLGRADIARAAACLKNRFRFSSLVDLCATDEPARHPRFTVVYQLFSFREGRTLRLRLETGEEEPVPSVAAIWPGAAWAEREIWDLFGVRFSGHPGLTRLLLWEGFEGHPLRKDFPLAGRTTGAAAGQPAPEPAPTSLPATSSPATASPATASPATSSPAASSPAAGEAPRPAAPGDSPDGSLELTFGPHHPALHGLLRLRVRLAGEGERVASCEPLIGHLHRGVEKLFEAQPLPRNLPFVDRLDFAAAATSDLAYSGAVEKLLGLAVPRRARLLRTLLAELQRIASHLLWLATATHDLGVIAAMPLCLGERETVLDLFERYCGARLTLSCICPGGVPFELPERPPDSADSEGASWTGAWSERCRELLAGLPARLDEIEERLTGDRGWRQRTAGIGVLSPETALDHGVTGPVLRGSGVDFDLRKALPYEVYGELDFEVPLGQNGDAYDRYLVRLGEMRQSARMAGQCLDLLAREDRPAGERSAEDRPAASAPGAPPVAAQPDTVPAPTGTPSSGVWAALPAPAAGAEVYHGVEGPRGEIGFYLAGDGTPRLARCHVRAPSFHNLQVLSELVRGHSTSDLLAILGSLDIALGEVDR